MAGNKQIVRLITLIFNQRAAAVAQAQMAKFMAQVRAQATHTAGFIQRVPGNLLNFSASLGKSLGEITRATMAAGAAIAAYVKGWMDLADRGGKVVVVQSAFNKLIGNSAQGIAKLRQASRGLISDYDLMRQANLALQLGAARNIDDVSELVSVSQDLGRALGIDAVKALNDLTIGVGRNSRRILDNLGIIVKGTLNFKSAMEAARERVAQLGGTVDTGADQVRRFQTSMINLRDAIATFVSESSITRTFFFELTKIVDTVMLAFQTKNADKVKEAFKQLGSLAATTFMFVFLETASTIIGMIGRFLAEKFDSPFAKHIIEFSEFLGKKSEESLATMEAQMEALKALGRQFQSEIEKSEIGKDPLKGLPPIIDPDAAEELRKEEDKILTSLLNIREALIETHGTFKDLEIGVDDAAKKMLDDLGFAMDDANSAAATLTLTNSRLVDIYLKEIEALKNTNMKLDERARLMERIQKIGEALGIAGISLGPLAGVGPPNPAGATIRPLLPGETLPAGFVESPIPRAGDSSFLGGDMPTAGELVALARGRDPALALAGFYDEADQMKLFFTEHLQEITSAAQVAAEGIMNAFGDAFEAMGEKSDAFKELELERQRRLKEASTEIERQKVDEWYQIERENVERMDGLWESLAKGFAYSILSGIAQIAGAEAGKETAYALGALAKGILGNPAGYAAAATHAKAAAAWMALGAVTGGAARALAPGGGGGFAGGSFAGSDADRVDTQNTYFYINFNPFDPDDPVTVEMVHKAGMRGQQQWGGQIPTGRSYAVNTKTGDVRRAG